MNTTLQAALLTRRPLVLDGAMGTMIQSYGYREGINDLLCLTHPEVILDIHRRYLLAGADIIETNTFNAQRISLADYGCQDRVREINEAAVHIAREAIGSIPTSSRPRFVVGSVGPTSKSLSMSPDISDPALRAITFDEMAAAYEEQMTALISAGADALLLETFYDTLNAKAALYAAMQAMNSTSRQVPLMLSVTVSDRAGRLLSGQTLDALAVSVAHAPLLTLGLNCSFGAQDMLAPLRHMRAHVPYYISAYPNAGLPNQLGEYDETPESMVEHVRPLLEEHLVDIIGGCCGTTDSHIRAIRAAVDANLPAAEATPLAANAAQAPAPSRQGQMPACSLALSGLEPLYLTPEVGFINIGERCNVAGSRKFLRLIQEKNYEEAVGIARKQVEDGALVLDINMDDGLLDTRSEMCHFLNLLAAEPDVCRVPFMIDSSNWEVIRAALRCIQGKAVVNSISLKEGEAPFLEHARELRRLGAAAIVMAFDEEGQATTYERRIQICERAYRLLVDQVGFPAEDIIFDPNVLAIATGMSEHDAYAADFIRATAWIRQNLPGAHVSGGVSNLSFSFRGNNYLREAMHAVFLYHARQAGMDMAIVNPATKVTYADIPADQLQIIEDAILARTPDACERLIDLATFLKEQEEAQKAAPLNTSSSSPSHNTSSQGSPVAGGSSASSSSASSASASSASSSPLPLSQRLVDSLRRGATDHLEADLHEALAAYPSPVAIIEGPLMDGMNLVGQLFGEGKMFLPQVVKTARTMKRAVEILQPYLEAQTPEAASNPASSSKDTPAPSSKQHPRIIVATVKGDVHDTAKNIVATVMACNGYEVIDLGVMVPAEDIVAKALELHPDVIGLSGLITPSLEEMVHTVHLLAEAGIRVPVLIGGATTSRLHTALKIAPVYAGPVIHVRDASQNAPLAAPFLDPATAEQATRTLSAEQAALREEANREPSDAPTTFEEARARKPKFF